ncbi:MAG: hypothetical protein WCD38_11860 [Candidatus Tumulicola sp.]
MRRFLLCTRVFVSCITLFAFCIVAPTPVIADTTSLGCIYEGGSPTTPRINYPSLFECDANRNVKIAGSITATAVQPYAGTNGQTLTAASFVGVGALDGNGAFSPLQEDTGQNLLARIVTGSTTAVTQATGTNLHAVIDSGTVTANAGTGNFTVVQPTGTALHAVLDTTSTTAVTQATAANLNATVVFAAPQHVIADSGTVNVGTVTTLPAITFSAPQHVITDSGTTVVTQPTGTSLHAVLDATSTTAVTQATASNLNATVTQAQPGTATITSVASSASSVQLLASNASRKGYIFCNESTQIVYIAEGATATSAASGHSFALVGASAVPYACHEEHGTGVYTGAINAIWASANGAMSITEES